MFQILSSFTDSRDKWRRFSTTSTSWRHRLVFRDLSNEVHYEAFKEKYSGACQTESLLCKVICILRTYFSGDWLVSLFIYRQLLKPIYIQRLRLRLQNRSNVAVELLTKRSPSDVAVTVAVINAVCNSTGSNMYIWFWSDISVIAVASQSLDVNGLLYPFHFTGHFPFTPQFKVFYGHSPLPAN